MIIDVKVIPDEAIPKGQDQFYHNAYVNVNEIEFVYDLGTRNSLKENLSEEDGEYFVIEMRNKKTHKILKEMTQDGHEIMDKINWAMRRQYIRSRPNFENDKRDEYNDRNGRRDEYGDRNGRRDSYR